MFGLSHLPEILLLLLVALLVFGPKRMVEMGSSFGKAFREFRDATREMSWNNLLSDEPKRTAASTTDDVNAVRRSHEEAAARAKADAAAGVVEGSVEHVESDESQHPPMP